MTTIEDTHNFSDSEDEAPQEVQDIAYEADDEVQTISQVAHEETIAKLTQELQDARTRAVVALKKVVAERDEHIILFAKERNAHAEEMSKRQARIDYLMDQMISK